MKPTAIAPATQRKTFAARLRGFGPVGLLALLLILLPGNVPVARLGGMPILVPLGALLVLLWAHLSHTPWQEIGYVQPKNWIATVAVGVIFGVFLKFIMKALVMPLLGANPINPTYHFLTANRAALPAAVWTMIVSAGFGEETLFRGFLFERLGKLLGQGAGAKVVIVLITSLFFGAVHYPDQGLPGAEQATVVGLIFGAMFAISGRLAVNMCAHAAFDLTALAMIYWNLEAKVAHIVFR